jgi:hypothetical protein
MSESGKAWQAASAKIARIRQLIMWVHYGLGILGVLAYSYTRLGYLGWWQSSMGLKTFVMGAPALLPYIFSAWITWHLYTWQVNGPGALRLVAYLVLFIGASTLADVALLGTFGAVRGWNTYLILGAQLGGYQWGASLILDRI